MSASSKPFGPVMQTAYVVDDLYAAIDYWTETLGVGPFFVLDGIRYAHCHYLNRPLDLNMSAAVAYSGDLQIELIQQHDNAPSIFTERRPAGAGVHHVGSMTSDLDDSLDWLIERGGKLLQAAEIPGGGRIAYVEMGGGVGIYELADLAAPSLELFDSIYRASECWDGRLKVING